MPSAIELRRLFNEGRLGEMIVREFKGEIGRTYPMRDSEFMVGFESKDKTPAVDELLEKVAELYGSLGYEVQVEEHFVPVTVLWWWYITIVLNRIGKRSW